MAERKGKSGIRKGANAKAAKKSPAKSARAKRGGADAEGGGLSAPSGEVLNAAGKTAESGAPLFSPPAGCGGAEVDLGVASAEAFLSGGCCDDADLPRRAPCEIATGKTRDASEIGRGAVPESAVSCGDSCGSGGRSADEPAFLPASGSEEFGADILSDPGEIFAGDTGDKIKISRGPCEIAADKTRGDGAAGRAASDGAGAAAAGSAAMASSASSGEDGGDVRGVVGATAFSPGAQDAPPRDFSGHLERIRRAKREADAIAGGGFPDAAQASLAITWELVFDHLCGVSELTLAELNTLSGVIHKLSSSKIQLCAPEEADKARSGCGEIGEESIRKIEEKLGLL